MLMIDRFRKLGSRRVGFNLAGLGLLMPGNNHADSIQPSKLRQAHFCACLNLAVHPQRLVYVR